MIHQEVYKRLHRSASSGYWRKGGDLWKSASVRQLIELAISGKSASIRQWGKMAISGKTDALDYQQDNLQEEGKSIRII